jgi:hypothetical protein
MMVWLNRNVGSFIVNLNLNCNILKQFNRALVGQIKDLMTTFLLGFHVLVIGRFMNTGHWCLCL